jgi:hypothetical protein
MQRFKILLGFVATVRFFKEVRSKTRDKTRSRAHRLLAKSAYLEIFILWNYQDVKMLHIEMRKPSIASPAVQPTIGLPHSDPKYTRDMWMALWQYSSRVPWRLSYTPEDNSFGWGTPVPEVQSYLVLLLVKRLQKNYLAATEEPKNLNPSVHVSLYLIYICMCGGVCACVGLTCPLFWWHCPFKEAISRPQF